MADVWSILFIVAIGGTIATLWKPRSGYIFPAVATIGYAAIFIRLVTDPPIGMAVGDGDHTVLLLFPLIAGIGTVLYSILIPTRSRKTYGTRGNEAFDQDGFETESLSNNMPSWLGGKDAYEEEEEDRKRRRGRSTSQSRGEDHRFRIRGALRNRRKR